MAKRHRLEADTRADHDSGGLRLRVSTPRAARKTSSSR
jgi:hypothetical protein